MRAVAYVLVGLAVLLWLTGALLLGGNVLAYVTREPGQLVEGFGAYVAFWCGVLGVVAYVAGRKLLS